MSTNRRGYGVTVDPTSLRIEPQYEIKSLLYALGYWPDRTGNGTVKFFGKRSFYHKIMLVDLQALVKFSLFVVFLIHDKIDDRPFCIFVHYF